ncbi:hypothetical protein BZY95_05090 [Billgrantia desiderata SP1]|nr:hypothetical protein BZY95_05090 [Halomonas desiderata SP1]
MRLQLIQRMQKIENENYRQVESLLWLKNRLSSVKRLPPLRGWASSPDLLLELHEYISENKIKKVLEFGSGASTLVIADALGQIEGGKLVSIDHSAFYAEKTKKMLDREGLLECVDVRISPLSPWSGKHFEEDLTETSCWYSMQCLEDLKDIELMLVDGPPGSSCPYARYPALPALIDKLSPQAEVWLDDTIRQEEKDICERWAKDHGFDLEYYPLEKGLGRLSRYR